MKKILLWIGIGIVGLVVLVLLGVGFFLNGAVKQGVETIGSKVTKVDVRLDSVSLSPLSGSGSIKGFVLGNPKGFKTPEAVKIADASLALKPASLFSHKVVIRSIRLDAPEITFEGGFGGNNLNQILKNVQSSSSGSDTNAPAEKEKPGKRLEVDDFVITGAKLHVSVTGMGGKTIPVVLPDIHLKNLGTGPEGITAAELTRRVLAAVDEKAIQAANKAVADMGKNATGLTKDLDKKTGENVHKITKGIGDLFKKK